MWENANYGPGVDAGIVQTADGAIGCPNGFEWARSRTAARLRGRVRLVAGGMCFPSFPTWKATKPFFWDREHQTMLQLARETPGRMARVVGAPAVHASHVGDVVMETPYAPWLAWPTIMVGETVIADADGAIVAAPRLRGRRGLHLRRRRVGGAAAARPGAADVLADVDAGRAFTRSGTPRTPAAALHYLTKRALNRHPFQHDPAYGRDLPADVAATADPGRRREVACGPWAARGPSWAS